VSQSSQYFIGQKKWYKVLVLKNCTPVHKSLMFFQNTAPLRERCDIHDYWNRMSAYILFRTHPHCIRKRELMFLSICASTKTGMAHKTKRIASDNMCSKMHRRVQVKQIYLKRILRFSHSRSCSLLPSNLP
jgi:hypothetical protein